MSGDEQLTLEPSQIAKTLLDKKAKLDLLEKLRTQSVIFRGQKMLHKLVELKNRKLFGKEEAEAVTTPDDNVSIDSPITNHYYPPPAAPQKQSSGLLKTLIWAGMTGAGLYFGGSGIALKVGELAASVSQAISDIKQGDVTVNVPEQPAAEKPADPLEGQLKMILE